MNAKSVIVDGNQHVLIFNFEMSQIFVHDEPNPQEISYIFPNDLKICIYDTTFYSILTQLFIVIIIVFIYFMISLLHKMKSK